MKKPIFIFSLLLFSFSAYTQNYDLTQFKDFEQLAKSNPAFTGVLQKLRLLAANQGADLNISFETRVFKTDNYLGGGINQVSLDNVRRQSFYAAYNRDKKLKNNALLKIAVQADYVNKTFFKTNDAPATFAFTDFSGASLIYDSSTAANYSKSRSYVDIGFGLGYQGKRFLFGANARHLNSPKTSVNSNSDEHLPVEANAQFASYISIGKLNIMPTALFAMQDNHSFLQAGAGINYQDYTLLARYEIRNTTNAPSTSLINTGLTYRKGKIFAAATYQIDLNAKSGIDFSNIKLTLNASLRKPKADDETLLKYLSYLY